MRIIQISPRIKRVILKTKRDVWIWLWYYTKIRLITVTRRSVHGETLIVMLIDKGSQWGKPALVSGYLQWLPQTKKANKQLIRRVKLWVLWLPSQLSDQPGWGCPQYELNLVVDIWGPINLRKHIFNLLWVNFKPYFSILACFYFDPSTI